MEAKDSFQQSLQLIRKQAPVVLNLTNTVAMDLTANALLAVGALPIMAHEPLELSDLVKIASAVVINIGTLDKNFLASCCFALEEATKWGTPIIFDPVGAGATRLRTDTARTFLREFPLSVVRGNASEIMALFETVSTKGVDSTLASDSVVEQVKQHSLDTNTVFVVSGKTDFILFRGNEKRVEFGDPMMTRVTAMGCTATAIIGAFASVQPSYFEAAVDAMTLMGVAGEMAKKTSRGTGSFRTSFLDALSNI